MSILHTYHSKVPFRNIKGKPYVTVSAKGISNGLSDTYNDGADFGPDTLLNATSPDRYGSPYTQTAGIQEALNYAKNNGYKEVRLSEGVFTITYGVTLLLPFLGSIQNGTNYGMNFIGSGRHATRIVQQNYETQSQTVPVIAWEDPDSQYMTDNLPSYYPGQSGQHNNNQWYISDMSIYGNVVTPSSGYALGISVVNLAQAENSMRNYLTRVDITNIATPSSYGVSAALDMSGNEDTTIENCTLISSNSTPIIWLAPYGSFTVKHSQFASSTIGAMYSGYLYSQENVYWSNPIINYYCSIGSTFLNQMLLLGDFGIHGFTYNNYPISTAQGYSTHNLTIKGIGLQGFSGAPKTGYGYTIQDNTGANKIIRAEFDGNYINGQSYSWPSGAIGNNTNPGSYAKFNFWSANNIIVPNFSTPSVPASGTAVSNPYQVPVDVYLNGGAVTEIVITSFNSNAWANVNYTAFSSSSAVALNGLKITLKPSDSITLTYTTAPTWTWVPA